MVLTVHPGDRESGGSGVGQCLIVHKTCFFIKTVTLVRSGKKMVYIVTVSFSAEMSHCKFYLL